VGLDGKVYSGSRDATIRVWSDASVDTLEGDTGSVWTLAVGSDGMLYSGTDDAVCVWSCKGFNIVHTIKCRGVTQMALSRDGMLFTCNAGATSVSPGGENFLYIW